MWQKIKCFFELHTWVYFEDYYLENFRFRYCEHCRCIEMTDGSKGWQYVGDIDDYEIEEIRNHPYNTLNDPETIFKPR